jgi:hypothetical protein
MRRRNAEEDEDEGCAGADATCGSSSSGGGGRYSRASLGGTTDRRGRRRRRRRRDSKRSANGRASNKPLVFLVDACDAGEAARSVGVALVGTLVLIGLCHWATGGGQHIATARIDAFLQHHRDAAATIVGTTAGMRGAASSRKRPRNNGKSIIDNPHNFRVDTPNAPPCSAPLDPASIAYTLVTQMSSERTWMIGRHCQRWGRDQPVSVAVFTDRSLSNVTADAVAAGCERRQLAISLLDSVGYADEDYPVNELRNLALSTVRTSHVMYVDIDFWPSTTLRPTLESPYLRQELGNDPKLAVVVPAYQLYAHRLCGERENCKEKEQTNEVPSTMDDLRALLETEDVGVFDLESNWNGHGSTSYKTFLLQNEGELFDLPCINSNRYEPYLAFRYCRDLPPFQDAFTGYGKNKMTWAMHLRRSGYDFAQVGGAFVCHYPHFRSKAKLSWDFIPDLNVTDILAVSAEARKAAKQNRFNVVEKKDMIKGVDWAQTKRGKGDLLYLDYRKWLYDTVPDEARLKMCDETYTDDNKLWVN